MSSYYNALGLFVYLFPIQMDAAVRYAAKCAMPAEGHLGHVLRGLACDCSELTCGDIDIV